MIKYIKINIKGNPYFDGCISFWALGKNTVINAGRDEVT
jgi:hypothetical protein